MEESPYWLGADDFDNLDAETQEDIEARLYGMIHHATNDEIYREAVGSTTAVEQLPVETEHHESSPSQKLRKPETLAKPELNRSVNTNESNEIKVTENLTIFIDKPKTPVKSQSKALSNAEKMKSASQPASSRGKLPTRSPYKEYLVVEESKKPRKNLKRSNHEKLTNVIIISDDEDSRYQSINKITKVKEEDYAGRNKSPASDVSKSEVESDTEGSVIYLDTMPQASRDLFSSSSSELSDSDIEIISKSSKFINTSSELKLNTSGPLMGSSLATRVHVPEVDGWQQYCSKKWTPEMISYYSSAAAKVDLETMMRSIPRNVDWHLDREDRFGPDLQRNRYFGRAERGRCTNCRQCGHTAKTCPDPRKFPCCILCGKAGHKMQACPKKICLTCGESKKILIECCMDCRKERNAVCMICRQKHVTTRCPDLWRRYHVTTASTEEPTPSGITLKPSRMLYCCNCAGRGHLPKDCPDVPWSKYPTIDPTVRSYENPRLFLENITQNGSSKVSRSEDGNSLWVIDNPNSRSTNKRAKHLKYHISQESLSSEKQLQSAASSVMSEVKHVAITWRVQKKKRRIAVEFDGCGDTHLARTKFKKALTFSRKSDRSYTESKKSSSKSGERNSKENGGVASSSASTPSKANGKESGKEAEKDQRNKFLKITRGNADFINELVINCLNPWGNATHRTLKVRLTQTDKKHLGQHLSKFEQKHHVTITSTVSGQKLEINIHCGAHGRISAAVNAIIRCLDVMSKKPTKA